MLETIGKDDMIQYLIGKGLSYSDALNTYNLMSNLLSHFLNRGDTVYFHKSVKFTAKKYPPTRYKDNIHGKDILVGETIRHKVTLYDMPSDEQVVLY